MLCALAFGLVSAGAQPAQGPAFRIGLSLPLSGSGSILAGQFLAGAKLAVETLAPGGTVELVVADDGCATDLAELAAADLRSADVSLVTGLLCNEAAAAAAAAFEARRIPVIAAGARSERLMKDRSREGWNLWRIAPSDSEAAASAFAQFSSRWRSRPYAVVDDGTVNGRSLADEFRTRMEEGGLPPQFIDNFRPAQSTQAGLARRLQRAGVSAAFISAAPEDFAIVARDIRELAPGIELAGGPMLDLLPWIEQAQIVPAGVLAIIEPDPASLPSAKDLTLALDRNGIEPEPYVYLGYAALQLALAARRDDPGETTAALANTVFHTVLGNVDFDDTGRNVVNPYSLYVWQDGGFRPVEGGIE